MDVRMAKAGLMYAAIKRAVRDVYDEFEVPYQEEDIDAVVSAPGHMKLVIRAEYSRGVEQGEKRTAMVFELHRAFGVSEGHVRKIAYRER